jgi:hypothetical protein
MRRYLAIGLALFTACSSHPPHPLPGVAPFRTDELYLCPSGYDFAAYPADHAYFPPNHPARPSTHLRPDRCFVSAAEARAAGYPLAPTPQSDILVGQIYLVPIGRSIGAGCHRASQTVHFEILCPTYVPYRLSGFPVVVRILTGAFVLSGTFPGPPATWALSPGRVTSTCGRRLEPECVEDSWAVRMDE